MAYSKQTWDTTSYVNPTRMNHIEQGIYDASTNVYYEDVTITTDSNGFADLPTALVDKTINVTSISQRSGVELWLNYTTDTNYHAYVYYRKDHTAMANESIKFRIWKIR